MTKTQSIIGCILLTGALLTGCATHNLTTLSQALGKDNSVATGSVNTIYGTAKFSRANPMAGQTVSISPDGTITISAKP